MSSPCTKSTTMLSSPWTLWRPSTHMMTHEALESLRMWSWSQEHALGQVLLSPHGVYKELTCEFLASMSLRSVWVHYGEGKWNSRKKNSKGVWATIADGGTLPQGPRLLRSGAQCLRYVHKALANTFFARKALGQSMRGTPPTRSQLTTLGTKEEESLVLEGHHTYLCAAGVPTDKRRSTPPGWMDIKFCKTNLSLSTRSWMGDSNSSSPSIGWPSKLLLPNPELTTVLGVRTLTSDPLNADLGEPECYYFEEYEAPRMNPSVVAAHKRIGLLQKFNKWQGKAMERCKSPWTRW
ncbi:unnamed protein product [Microthlaspi erraticum]|uniref:Uncharacterized protein n=1 Tax=Microthlaspi erraticum TaxID=1685480 RepID=A0A6D2K498_9BRAS|nr:unnamed protein product [Microthlaspi erraticum]